MRCWHYKLIPVLPKEMLVSQWRECIAIKRQWEKETLKHRLVSYVKAYDKGTFYNYVLRVVDELEKRDISYQKKYLNEIGFFAGFHITTRVYKQHNDRYLKQCFYNLQEKHDRGIISDEEWKPINDLYWELDDKGYY